MNNTMNVAALTPMVMPVLFEFWYDLEVLRAQLFPLATPSIDSQRWCAEEIARLTQSNTVGVMCYANDVLGALAVQIIENRAEVVLFCVDVHTPERRAVGATLWKALKPDLLNRSVTLLRATARHNLPIEEAFWRAHKATRVPPYWEISL